MQYHPGRSCTAFAGAFPDWTAGSAPPCGSSGQSGSAGRSGPGRYPGKGQNALMALFLGLLTVSADMRAFLKRTIAIWTGPNVDIRYEVDGHKLTELPEGYAPHYIPEGFVYVETESYEDSGSFQKVYENADNFFIMVTVRIAENASLTSMDTEHTNFKKIDYGEGGAYLGTFENGDGYAMFWFADGIEHELYISAALTEDEVFKIADGISS